MQEAKELPLVTEAQRSPLCEAVPFGLEESGILQTGKHRALSNAHEVTKQNQSLLEGDVSKDL